MPLALTLAEESMKKTPKTARLSLGLICLLHGTAFAAEPLWQDRQEKTQLADVKKLNVKAKQFRLVDSHITQLQQTLLNRNVNEYRLELPMPDGKTHTFVLQYSPIYQNGFEKKYPSIRTFSGYQLDKPQNSGRFDITPHGFHGMFRYNGATVFIDPLSRDSNVKYISYFKKDALPQSDTPYHKVLEHSYQPSFKSSDPASHSQAGETLKTYRLAVSAAAEFTAFHGGTKEGAQAAIVTIINRINQLYVNDLSVQLNLIANNDEVIYTDAATDPFANTSDDIDTNRTVLNDTIGAANYDIGHIFNTDGGGLAYLGAVCVDSHKGGGVTGSSSPTGDPFIIDFVAHEFGHQFGANHSYNGTAGGCSTRVSHAAFEPGSGSTIMGYAGLCSDQNIQNASDDFFHSFSVEQIHQYIAGDGACHASTDLNNETPTVDAGGNFTIPASTPFMLTGSAVDADNDTLRYSWEQFETGNATNSAAQMIDDGEGPLFRTWDPTTSPIRYLPRMSDVLQNTTVIGEAIPTTTRDLTFKLIVRDGVGNINSDNMTVSVTSDAGPFAVTAPAGGDNWAQSSPAIVTWNTANTNVAPVSCANVDIMFSSDGGQNFSTMLASSTANDGNESVTVPSINTADARLMIKCSDNIFYAVNEGNFNVIVVDNQPVITATQAQTINEDSSLTVTLDMLTVVDTDSSPSEFSVQVLDGDNYSVSSSTVTPTAEFNGNLSVNVTVSDATSTSATAQIAVTVNAVNDVPVATDDSFSVVQDSSNNSFNFINNDSDADGDSLTVTGVNYSGSGTLTASSSGASYTPAGGFTGSDSFSYTISDGNGGTSEGNVTVTVTSSSTGGGSSSGGGGGSMPILLSLLLLPLAIVRRKTGIKR